MSSSSSAGVAPLPPRASALNRLDAFAASWLPSVVNNLIVHPILSLPCALSPSRESWVLIKDTAAPGLPPKADMAKIPLRDHHLPTTIFGSDGVAHLAFTNIDALVKFVDQPCAVITDYSHFEVAGTMADRNLAFNEAATWWSDRSFGYQRLAGFNPSQIRRLRESGDAFELLAAARAHFDLGELDASMPLGASFESEVAAGRVFVLDHRHLVALPSTTKGLHQVRSYVPGSLSLFHYGTKFQAGFDLEEDASELGRALYPFAIALQDSTNSGPLADFSYATASALFTPERSVAIYRPRTQSDVEQETGADGHSPRYGWKFAKLCVQAGEWTQHELSSHLTRTHLLVEAIMVPMMSTLSIGDGMTAADQHPVYNLLKPHMEKTIALNDQARTILLPLLLTLQSGTNMAGLTTIIARTWSDVCANFRVRVHPRECLAERLGLDLLANPFVGENESDYPYAQDALKLFDAIESFVRSVLIDHYSSVAGSSDAAALSAAVAADKDVNEWSRVTRSASLGDGSASDHSTGAGIANFPRFDHAPAEAKSNFDELVDAVSIVIFIASVQHSAVNYEQLYYMGYAPNVPASLFGSMPSSSDALSSMDRATYFTSLTPHTFDAITYSTQAMLSQPVGVAGDASIDFTLLQYANNMNADYHDTLNIKHTKGDRCPWVSETIKKRLPAFAAQLMQISEAIDARCAKPSYGLRAFDNLSPTCNTMANGITI